MRRLSRRRVHFDLRTKIIILAAVNILLFMGESPVYEGLLTGSCLAVTAWSGQRKSAGRFFLIFAVMMLAEQMLMPALGGFTASLILFITVSVRKVLPCLIIGKWILTDTEVSEFVAVMWKLRFSPDVIIPVSVVFRYFPTLKEEWQALRMAMKMRGIGLSVEHVLVPLMMSAVQISDELSAAALCRGLDAPGPHTCLRPVRLARPDYLAISFFALMTAAGVGCKAGGIL